jgi:hypothetical protein
MSLPDIACGTVLYDVQYGTVFVPVDVTVGRSMQYSVWVMRGPII